MTGVEILASEEVVMASSFNWGVFTIVTLGLMAVFALVGWAADPDNYVNGWLIGISIGSVLAIVIGLFLGAIAGEPTEYETHYKITISDEVSMNEFLEHYEIIDQEGKIYTVRERE